MKQLRLLLLLFPLALAACGESTPETDEPIGELPATEGPAEDAEGCVTLIYATDEEIKKFYYQKVTPCLAEGSINEEGTEGIRIPFQEAVAKLMALDSPAGVEVIDIKFDNGTEAESLVVQYRDVKEFEVIELEN